VSVWYMYQYFYAHPTLELGMGPLCRGEQQRWSAPSQNGRRGYGPRAVTSERGRVVGKYMPSHSAKPIMVMARQKCSELLA